MSSDITTQLMKAWVNNGLPEEPSQRLAYGGVTFDGYVHLKKTDGSVIKYSVTQHSEKDKGAK